VVDGLGDILSNSPVLVGGGAQSVELTPHVGPGNFGAFTVPELSAAVKDIELQGEGEAMTFLAARRLSTALGARDSFAASKLC
jgi:hypothetical protein